MFLLKWPSFQKKGLTTMKENIAKWDYTDGVLSLQNAKTKAIVYSVNLTEEINGFAEMPEFVQFYIQYGIRQKSADPNASAKGEDKLEGYRLSFEAWKEITFARAKAEKGESISINKIKSQIWSLVELRIMKDMFPKMGKTFPPEMEAKLKEFEALASEQARKPKNQR